MKAIERLLSQVSVLAILATQSAGVESWTRDPSFGSGGIAATELGTSPYALFGLDLLPSGAILAAGGSSSECRIVRYLPNGMVDDTWGPVVVPNNARGALAVQSDGKVLVGGCIGNHYEVYRYTEIGMLDDSWGTNGLVSLYVCWAGGSVGAIRQQPDGKIVVSGTGDCYMYPPPDRVIFRLNQDGIPDASFGNGGEFSIGPYWLNTTDLLVQAGGGLITTGANGNYGSPSAMALTRTTTQGVIDPCFANITPPQPPNYACDGGAATVYGNSGTPADDSCVGYALAATSTGALISVGGAGDWPMLAKFSANGIIEASFGNGGVTVPTLGGVAYDVVVDPDDRIVTASGPGLSLMRFLANGAGDVSFNGTGIMTDALATTATRLVRQSDGKYIVGGGATNGIILGRYKDMNPKEQTDVVIRCTGPAGPVRLGDAVTYQVTLTNQGPGHASAVIAQCGIPARVGVQSLAATQGDQVFADGTVTWTAGDLTAGSSASMEIVCSTDSIVLESRASAWSVGADQDSTNNQGVVRTLIHCDPLPGAPAPAGALPRVSGSADWLQRSDTEGIANEATSGPCSLWGDSVVPGGFYNDGSPIEVGLKFTSAVPGFITGVRYLKGQGLDGAQSGQLWSRTGQLLGAVDFAGGTSSGWQTAYFPIPVPIAAGVTYVAAVYSPGPYAYSGMYFHWGSHENYPLTALQDGLDGGNGVFSYASGSPVFPTSTYNGSNYWVDVVYDPASATALCDVRLCHSGPAGSPAMGSRLEYKLVVTNGGIDTAQSVTVRDMLPPALEQFLITASRGTSESANGLVVWNVGDMSPGASDSMSIAALIGPVALNSSVSVSGYWTEIQPADNSQATSVVLDCARASGVDQDIPGGRALLHANIPNPFNPTTTIGFDLPDAGSVRLSVFDIAGRLVRTIVDDTMPQGSHEAVWNGRDSSGREVSSGSYLARLEFGEKVETVHMGLIR